MSKELGTYIPDDTETKTSQIVPVGALESIYPWASRVERDAAYARYNAALKITPIARVRWWVRLKAFQYRCYVSKTRLDLKFLRIKIMLFALQTRSQPISMIVNFLLGWHLRLLKLRADNLPRS